MTWKSMLDTHLHRLNRLTYSDVLALHEHSHRFAEIFRWRSNLRINFLWNQSSKNDDEPQYSWNSKRTHLGYGIETRVNPFNMCLSTCECSLCQCYRHKLFSATWSGVQYHKLVTHQYSYGTSPKIRFPKMCHYSRIEAIWCRIFDLKLLNFWYIFGLIFPLDCDLRRKYEVLHNISYRKIFYFITKLCSEVAPYLLSELWGISGCFVCWLSI